VAAVRAGVVLAAVVAAALTVSGGSRADPRTPPALPGLPPPFLGVAVVGSGGRTEAIDAYGNVVGRWTPGPAGRSLIYNPPERQAAGSVPVDTGVVARARIDGSWVPFWQADSVRQRYLPGSNVLRTVARFGERTVAVTRSVGGAAAAEADRRWLGRARPLGSAAPRWARAMYRRSLLVLRALADRRTGAVAAGAREGWAYVWPRDASAVAMALAAAGYGPEARRVVHFLESLDLETAARFTGNGDPVTGRAAQGDAAAWITAAAQTTGATPASLHPGADEPGSNRDTAGPLPPWEGLADYQEGDRGNYLGNALAGGWLGAVVQGRPPPVAIHARFATTAGLVHEANEPGSGLDSAAAWVVRPFPQPALFPLARRALLRLPADSTRFGILPSEDWDGGEDPWTAPTAWSAWSLAALARHDRTRLPPIASRERHAAMGLIRRLRRAATPAGLLPERVDVRTGIPRSTTPLAWSHAFAILALRELWPTAPKSADSPIRAS